MKNSKQRTSEQHFHVSFMISEIVVSEATYSISAGLDSVKDFMSMLESIFKDQSKDYLFVVEKGLYEIVADPRPVGIFGGEEGGFKIVWESCSGCAQPHNN